MFSFITFNDIKKTIRVFNYGEMESDFTFIDDVVEGIFSCSKNLPPEIINFIHIFLMLQVLLRHVEFLI
tara:strand:- start:744 stop:950 length:207 start_codon:yes stop_codon:yes gene_type:complete